MEEEVYTKEDMHKREDMHAREDMHKTENIISETENKPASDKTPVQDSMKRQQENRTQITRSAQKYDSELAATELPARNFFPHLGAVFKKPSGKHAVLRKKYYLYQNRTKRYS